MFLKDFTTSDKRKVAQINKALKEAFGFTLAANVESGKLQSLYTKIADDLYNLKLNLGTVRDKEYTKKLLIKEGLGILLKNIQLDEALLAGAGANAYERVLKWLSEFVTNACEVGDDYEEAIYDAMKHYRSSKYRFNDAMVEQDLRNSTAHCSDVNELIPEGVVGGAVGAGIGALAGGPIGAAVGGGIGAALGKDEKVNEDPGHSILDIITPEELKRLKGYVAGNGELYQDEELYDKLYTYYVNSGEMPYGVAKARSGDPDEWILDQVIGDYGDEVSGFEEGVVGGAVGAGIGAVAGGPVGAALGGAVGASIGKEEKEVKEGGRNPDRHAEREWSAQLAAEQPEKREVAKKFAPTKAKDPKGEDYYSYMSRKTTRETTEMKEGYVKKLRALLEAEVEQAESIIAAKGFSQELQDMVEKLGRLVNEDLPAVVDQMRDAYGADVATGFEDAVGQTLSGVMDSLKASKQEVDGAVDSIATGGTPAATNDMESPELNDLEGDEGDGELDLDMGDELDIGDDFGGADAAAGEEEPLGRAKKESVNRAAQLSRKILETKARLNRAKAEKAKTKAKK